MEDKQYDPNIRPADRLADVNEYYFSRKLKEVARMNEAGMDIISLAIGSPDMPPSPNTIETLCREARRRPRLPADHRHTGTEAGHGRLLPAMVWRRS